MIRDQKGFTLVEMIVASALIAIVVAAASGAIFPIVTSTEISNEQTIALRQVQNTGYWLSRDTQMAQTVTVGVPPEYLTLGWVDWNGNVHTIRYFFEGNKLKRQLNGSPATLIAEYIDLNATTVSWDATERRLSAAIKASFGKAAVERTYETVPRPNAG